MSNHTRTTMFYAPALRYFVAVAQHESIRSAARSLNVASSAVNRHILKLEREFGLQLFERVGRKLRLSEAGDILQRHAIRALADFDDAVSRIDDLSGLKSGQVRVAAVESVADSLLPKIVGDFQKDYPGIDIDIQVGSAALMNERILSSECHLALTFVKADETIGEELFGVDLPLCAAVGNQHPLAARTSVTMRDCVAYPLALPKTTLSFGEHVFQLLSAEEKAGYPALKKKVSSNSLRFMRSLIGDNQTVAFQTKLGLHSSELTQDIRLIPLQGVEFAPDRLTILCTKSEQLPKAPVEFAKYAQRAFEAFNVS